MIIYVNIYVTKYVCLLNKPKPVNVSLAYSMHTPLWLNQGDGLLYTSWNESKIFHVEVSFQIFDNTESFVWGVL